MARFALALVVLLTAASLTPVVSSASPERLIVGYAEGHKTAALAAMEVAGASIHRTSDDLHFAVVFVDDGARFRTAMSVSPYIQYVERDGATRLTGAQWNGAQWNGAQWNGAQWNGAQWNGAQWNGAQWNGAQWNDKELSNVSDDQRAAAKWTEKHYQSDSTNKMKWAGESTDPGMVWQWSHWAADANHAWTAGATGTRTASLCVLDSGVAWDHPDIAPNYAAGHNAIDPARSAYDDGGHGTHIAGIAAGALADGRGIAGVGNVQILNAKVLAGDGTGYESDLAFGLIWCAKQDAEVAVMALGVTDTDHPTLQRALQYAAQRDVLLLASAGNTGCDGCVNFPASDPRVVAVGAVDGNLAPAPWSSRGAQVELAAPGVAMLSAFPGNNYVFGSGTSQAVAYAAGAAALLRDHQTQLSATDARAQMSARAVDLGATGRDASTGHGLVDVRALLR